MKAKKKIKKIKEIMEQVEDGTSGILKEIEDIVYEWDTEEEEPEPEFEVGDDVSLIGIDVLGYDFVIQEPSNKKEHNHRGLVGQIKIATWVEPEDIEKL